MGADSEDRVYVLAVAGHVFTAHLITYLSVHVDRMSAASRKKCGPCNSAANLSAPAQADTESCAENPMRLLSLWTLRNTAPGHAVLRNQGAHDVLLLCIKVWLNRPANLQMPSMLTWLAMHHLCCNLVPPITHASMQDTCKACNALSNA